MKFNSLLTCLCILVFAHLHAQENVSLENLLDTYPEKSIAVDSLINSFKSSNRDSLKADAAARLYYVFLYNEPKIAKLLAKKELELLDAIGSKSGMGMANYHIGAFFQNASKNDSAKHYLNKSLAIFKELGIMHRYAGVISSLAFIADKEGNYDSALSKFDEALEIYKKTSMYQYAITQGDRANIYLNKGYYKIALQETLEALKVLDTIYNKPWRRADAQRQVGHIELLRKNYENAIYYYKKAAQVYIEQDDNVYLSGISNDIGNTFYYMNKIDSAVHHSTKGLELARKYGVSENEANALSNLGKVYIQKREPKKALEYLEEALKIHTVNNYKASILGTQNDIGNAFLQMGQAEKAITFLNRTVESATANGPINDLKTAHKYRFQAYKELGQLSQAIEDQLVFQKLNDSIFNAAKSRQIEELRTIYETEKKEQEIALKEQEITVLEQEASISNLQRLLLAIGLLLSLIGIYAIRQKMKRNKLEKEKVDAELEFKKKELTIHALNLARKNETLENLKLKAQELKEKENTGSGYTQLIRTINFDLQDDNNWENFSRYFEEVHKDFNSNVKTKYPDVTSNELRLLALLKMNLSSKEIANILNISPEGIKKARYRLRKKLNITTEDSLQDLVLSL